MLLRAIELLLERGHEVTLVATCRARAGAHVLPSEFASLAETLSAEFIESQRLDTPDALAAIRRSGAELAVSIDWVGLLPASVCEAFPSGILNLHAGDLPRYRGNSPIAWAILAGEDRIGVTVHLMDAEEFDSGPIVCKSYYPIDSSTYMHHVFEFVEVEGPRLLAEAVDGIAAGRVRLVPQDSVGLEVLRCYPRTAADGQIDWSASAEHIVRLVRASSEPYAGAFTYFEGHLTRVWRARWQPWREPSCAVPGQCVSRDLNSGEVGIASGNGVVVLEEVQLEGGQRVASADVIRSTRARLGA